MFGLENLLSPNGNPQQEQTNPFADFQNDIIVQGQPFRNEIQGGGNLGIQGLLEAGNPDVERARQAGLPEHKGMFGVKGTLRDVLGLVGDAFLVQGGRDPMYRNKRQQERESDALHGYQQDPAAALERLAQINPQAAMKAFQQLSVQQARQQELAQKQAEFAAEGPERKAKTRKAVNDARTSVLKSVRPALSGATEKNWPVLREQLFQYFINNEMEEFAELLPEEYSRGVHNLFMDPEVLARLEDADLSREQRAQIAAQASADRRLGIATSAGTAAANEAGRNARHQDNLAARGSGGSNRKIARPAPGGKTPPKAKPSITNW